MCMRNFNIILFIFLLGCFKAQNRELDSLNRILQTAKNDTTRAAIYVALTEHFASYNLDTLKPLCLKAIEIIEKHASTENIKEKKSYINTKASALNNLAYYYQYKGDVTKALEDYFSCLKLREESGDKLLIAGALNNIGYIYSFKGENTKALDYYFRSLKIQESIKDDNGAALTLNNIGSIYFGLGDYNKALDNFKRSLKIQQKIGNVAQIALYLNNIAFVYQTKGDSSMAFEYYRKGLEIREKINDKNGIAIIYNNLGTLFDKYKNFTKALYYYKECLKIQQEMGDSSGIPNTLNNIGGIYIEIKDYKKALDFSNQSFILANRVGSPKFIYLASTNLYHIYKATNKFKEALDMYKLSVTMKDSINNQETRNSLFKKELKYDFDKKALADSLKVVADKRITEVKLKQEKTQRYALYGGVFVLMCVAVFIFNRLQVTKKQNLIIENQKMEVELKNEEITVQKELVEEKQKEIIDSINYAKRIQQAVLTGEDVWQKISKEHFILFKPKDIVSGDFYWAYNTPNNRSVFALADCTGHGVPGGFMSMLGNSFLNEIVVENKIFKADEILNRLRSKIISALEQKGGTQQKDGMDISLCVWNKLDNTLEFAGANNPLWLLRGKELLEYKADKMPIGTYLETEVPFSSTVIPLQQGDIVFLSTDGYADQFGGPKGKKYKYKPLIESLIKHSNLSMEEQKIALETAFNNWKHQHEQVDDVSLIGIKVG